MLRKASIAGRTRLLCVVDQLLLRRLALRLHVLCRLLRRPARIELLDDLGADAIQLLLREDTKESPGEV